MGNVFEKSKVYINDFLAAIFGGLSISIGCLAYLKTNGGVVGSFLFSIGLFMILGFGFNLFTSKVSLCFELKKKSFVMLPIVWFGNLLGCLTVGLLIQLTRLNAVQEFCKTVVATKLSENIFSSFFLAILCNLLIYFAVYGYKNLDNVGKYVSVFLGVGIFVFCGFEHCVADMFFFTFANAWSWKAIGYIVVITLGNLVGGLLIPTYFKIIKNKKVTENTVDKNF